MVGWVAGWLVGWLVGWVVGWLGDWVVSGWLVGWVMVCWVVGWLVGWVVWLVLREWIRHCMSMDYKLGWWLVTNICLTVVVESIYRCGCGCDTAICAGDGAALGPSPTSWHRPLGSGEFRSCEELLLLLPSS